MKKTFYHDFQMFFIVFDHEHARVHWSKYTAWSQDKSVQTCRVSQPFNVRGSPTDKIYLFRKNNPILSGLGLSAE